jgi:hypothetical protein
MRAKKIDANQVDIVKALRQYGCSVTHLHEVGRGCPDLLIGIHGRTGLLELKDGTKPPSARTRTLDQKEWVATWKGGPHALVTDVDGALRFARVLAFGPNGSDPWPFPEKNET